MVDAVRYKPQVPDCPTVIASRCFEFLSAKSLRALLCAMVDLIVVATVEKHLESHVLQVEDTLDYDFIVKELKVWVWVVHGYSISLEISRQWCWFSVNAELFIWYWY